MAHEIETMAYAGAVPWHGLGNNVDRNVSIEEMTKQAGLDWTVRLLPTYAYDEVSKDIISIPRKALVRSSDNKVLTVTGDNWNPLQNTDMMEFFREYCDAGGATLETAGSLRGGKVVWALAALNDQFTLGGDDLVKGYILLVSPHEVGTSIQGFTTTVRVVCANTMRMALNGASGGFRQHHMQAFDAKAAKESMGLHKKNLGQARLEAEALSKLAISEFESVRFLARFFQPEFIGQKEPITNDAVENLLSDVRNQSKPLEQVIDSLNNAPGARPGTGWGVLNAVTHYCDHKAGRAADARLFNSWLGDRSRLKLDVNRQLLALTE